MPVDRDVTLRSAEKLLRQGRLDAAIAEYVRLTAAYPNDWSSVNALGDLYVRAGQIDRAVAQFARVADRLRRDGALPKASAVYRKILRASPGDPRGTRGLAAITAQQAEASASTRLAADDPDARMHAAREALDACDVSRGCELLVEAADLYMARSRPADAIAAIAEAADADPANVETRHRTIRMLIEHDEIVQARHAARTVAELLMVAEAFEQAGRHAEALDLTSEAAALDPDNLGLRHRILTAFVAAGEIDRARRLARTVSELLVVADALARDDRNAEALEVLGEAVGQAPASPALRARFLEACLKSGAVERARQTARSADDWRLVADALGSAGSGRERLEAMKEAVAREPHNAALHCDLVRTCVEAGDFAEAHRTARTTAELLAVAEALDAQGDAAAALQVRTDALRRDPDDPELRARLMREFVDAGLIDRARWLGRTPGELLGVADLLDQRGRSADALDLRIEALQRAPADRRLQGALVDVCLQRGDLDRARRAIDVGDSGDDPDLIRALAALEFRAGRFDEGVQALDRFVAQHGDHRFDLIPLASEMAGAGRADAADACLERFALAAARLGDCDGAAAGLQEFSRRVPLNVPALSRLVEVCVDGGLHAALASAQAQLADAYLAEGRAAEARVVAEDLFTGDPWEPGNAERLRRALALQGHGDPDRALAELLSADAPLDLEDL